ncbi:MAG: hypothetical protein MUC56_01770 [Thermoanaerobaculales bacterium]|jgi:hypothetical protein|nr:hypothetical protein [Thermoanaerobaculales bacterium]
MGSNHEKLPAAPVIVATALALLALPAMSTAIEAAPSPGQLDVLQGTVVALDGTPPPDGPRPDSYRWEIVEGDGGRLYDADRENAMLQTPVIEDELEVLVVRLTVTYPDGPPATSTVHILVHREPPEHRPAPEERSIEQVMSDFYREEREARDRNRERLEASRPTVVQQSISYGWISPGYGWGWGWPTFVPVSTTIVAPPPGVDLGPASTNSGVPLFDSEAVRDPAP